MRHHRPDRSRDVRAWCRRVLVVGIVASTFPLAGLPAHAASPLRPGGYYEKPAPFEDAGEFDPECPGMELQVAYEVSGIASVRNLVGSRGQAFLGKDKSRFSEVWTDVASGRVLFTVHGAWVFEEISARRVRESDVPRRLVPANGLKGPIFEFTAIQTGGDVIRDEAGALLYWEGGQFTFTNLFDTHGDHEPGGRSLRFRTVKSVGHLPLANRDICEVAAEQLATP